MAYNRLGYKGKYPESTQTVFYPLKRVLVNYSKFCLLETDNYCPYYEDWLFAQKQEELDRG